MRFEIHDDHRNQPDVKENLPQQVQDSVKLIKLQRKEYKMGNKKLSKHLGDAWKAKAISDREP